MDRFAHARDVVIKPLWLVVFALWTFAGVLQQARDGLNDFAQIKLGVENLMGWLPDFSLSTWLVFALVISLLAVFEGSFQSAERMKFLIEQAAKEITQLRQVRPNLKGEITGIVSSPAFVRDETHWAIVVLISIRNVGNMASAIMTQQWSISFESPVAKRVVMIQNINGPLTLASNSGPPLVFPEDRAMYKLMSPALAIGEAREGFIVCAIPKAEVPDLSEAKVMVNYLDVLDNQYNIEAPLRGGMEHNPNPYVPFAINNG